MTTTTTRTTVDTTTVDTTTLEVIRDAYRMHVEQVENDSGESRYVLTVGLEVQPAYGWDDLVHAVDCIANVAGVADSAQERDAAACLLEALGAWNAERAHVEAHEAEIRAVSSMSPPADFDAGDALYDDDLA